MNEKDYFLMHKDIPVALFSISNEGKLFGLRRIEENAIHFPIGGQMNDSKFHEWWNERAIPKTRHGARSALERLGYSDTENMMINELALSLSDCYWIKPRGSDLFWKDVNLFSNDFVDAFGELNLNENIEIDLRSLTKFSPSTSQGELQKKWIVSANGKRYLIKGNFGASCQQSLNEVFASNLHRQLGCENFVPYSLSKLRTGEGNETIGCQSECFTNENTEAVSFWEILQTVKFNRNEPLYHPLKKACLGIGATETEFDDYMDYLILSDYLITNIDRHLNNMAILRNPDTLKFIGFAPLYDFGNSMFYNLSFSELPKVNFETIKTNGFTEKEIRMLKYVKNRKCINLDSIKPDFSIYDRDVLEQQMRYPLIKELFEKKILSLKSFQAGKK